MVIVPAMLTPYVVDYGTALIQSWEDKDGDSTDGFLIFSTLASYLVMASTPLPASSRRRSSGTSDHRRDRAQYPYSHSRCSASGAGPASRTATSSASATASWTAGTRTTLSLSLRALRHRRARHQLLPNADGPPPAHSLRPAAAFRPAPEDWELHDPSLLTRDLLASQQKLILKEY